MFSGNKKDLDELNLQLMENKKSNLVELINSSIFNLYTKIEFYGVFKSKSLFGAKLMNKAQFEFFDQNIGKSI